MRTQERLLVDAWWTWKPYRVAYEVINLFVVGLMIAVGAAIGFRSTPDPPLPRTPLPSRLRRGWRTPGST